LVGRDRELEQLRTSVAAAKAGQGGLVLLTGETGVGKTSLAEAAVSTGEIAVLRGFAPQRGSVPYGAIAAALREFLRGSEAGLSELGPLQRELGALLPELGRRPKNPERELLFEAIRRAFETVAGVEPTVVFLDDLQWADAATLELLSSLAASAEEWPLLLLGAYRSEEIPRGHPLRRLRTELRRAGRLAELVVEPLDPAATAAVAARVLGAAPGPMLTAALFDRTQGVPFFVEELAAALKSGSLLVEGKRGLELEPGAAVPLPETIRDVVRLRAEELSAEARASLEAAAVAGMRFELALLSALGEDAGVGEALEHGLLMEDEPGVATFRHDLVREAVYSDTPWPRRRALHRALAERLGARTADPKLVADHWLAAGETARARPFLVDAARRACALHAYRDAATAWRRALEIWPEAEDASSRLSVLDELGRCAELCGELAEAARAWEELAAALGPLDLAHRAETKRRLATVYELRGARSQATSAHLEAADAFARSGRDADAARERLQAAGALFRDDPARSAELVEEAFDEARRAGAADVEGRCLLDKAHLASRDGCRDESIELTRSALALALEHGHVEIALDAYWSLGAIANTWADYPQAQTALEDAVAFCRAHDLPADENYCVSCLAVVLKNRGDWQRAEELSRAVLATEAAPDHAKAHALCVLGLIAVARGATKRARPLLRQALGFSGEMAATCADCEFGLALADELDGAPRDRWRELVTASMKDGAAPATALRWAATFAARGDDATLVHECAESLSRIAARFGSADILAALAHALGEIALLEGDAVRAAEQFDQALELIRDVDAPFQRAHIEMRAGVALATAGEREVAVNRLVDAYRTFRKLGARPFAHQAAAELEALGEQIDRRLGRRAARDLEHGGLTRRELEILRLVAVGRTNREIARDLFLSPRTVEMHVRNVLSKLDCRSRAEATGRAHTLGLLGRAVAG
jgi:predicted ATPase/DNA-binding CsgD family transcriptional regulator